MFRKTGTTFAGSFAAAHPMRRQPQIEQLEDRQFLSASFGLAVDAGAADGAPQAISVRLTAVSRLPVGAHVNLTTGPAAVPTATRSSP